jgi:hypothetical protein
VFDEFVLALSRQAEVATRPLELSDILIRGLDKTDSQEILSAVLSLYRTWASAGDMTAETFVGDVSKAIAVFDPAGDSIEGKGRLRKILDIEPLASSSKAFAVLTDNERDFHDVKILTDIRYAFRPDPAAKPYGAGIVHLLKLTYHEEYEHKSFYVALDGQDLKLLRAAIDRAETKERHLQQQLEITQTHYFGEGDEEWWKLAA